MSYGEFARITATPFDLAVDKAINDINKRANAEIEREQAACPHADTQVWGDKVEYSVEVCMDCGHRDYSTQEVSGS